MKVTLSVLLFLMTLIMTGCGGGSSNDTSLSGISDASFVELKTISHAQSYAKFYKPERIIQDDVYLYVSDTANNCIRRISPDGTVITVIGSVTGVAGDNTDTAQKGTSALLSGPTGMVAVTIGAERHLFIADTGNNKILDANITGNPKLPSVVKIAGNKSSGYRDDSNGSKASFFQPHGLYSIANTLYVADTMNHAVRSIDITSGGSYGVSTLTDSMEATSQPVDLSVDGNTTLLVLLKGANRVDAVSISKPTVIASGVVTGLNAPEGLVLDGTTLYISSTQDHTVLAYDITTWKELPNAAAGAKSKKGNYEGTTLRSALFDEPVGLFATTNELFVVDRGNHKIRKILKTEKLVRTVMGSGEAGIDLVADDTKQKIEEFYKPEGIIVNPEGKLYFCDTQNQKIRRIDIGSGSKTIISTFIGQNSAGSTQGNSVGTLSTTKLYNPTSLVGLWDTNQTFYIVDSYNHVIKKAVGQSTTFFAGSSAGYGDGNTTQAQFNRPYSAVADQGGNLYVTDTYNHRIRKITPSGVVTTLAGKSEGDTDGQGINSQFSYPTGIVFDGSNTLYVLDNGNKKIRKVTLSGAVSTVTITGRSFINLYGIAIAPKRGTLYVSDIGENRIWAINLATLKARSLIDATTGQWVDGNNSNTPFTHVQINHPKGMFYDENSDKLYISDTDNNIIRILSVKY
ncbi:MAG: SMP-30/gluconolactonase/LRE family protein [Sulfuricurvum sp.]|uniref:SMP-30/gluconolactonase/LRE family protein n=1 Tax=Sulfuricurvum sp. TaxID=2025608 RepID=UPI0025F82C1C|nr:SMP-30/gluconolactonase/LRE family protein [Sulfuricurvum sp.]MCK9372091.1 SMP-30/gluconolactonase/LRE family protein [Sulfuricurvum sp.]